MKGTILLLILILILQGCANTKLLEDKDNPANSHLKDKPDSSHLGVKTTIGF